MGMEKLLWYLRGRYSKYRVQRVKDFDFKSNVKLVYNFKEKNEMYYLEVQKRYFGCSKKQLESWMLLNDCR